MAYKDIRDRDSAGAPAELYGAAVEGEDFSVGTCRYLLVGTAGTVTLVRYDGQEIAGVPLEFEQLLPAPLILWPVRGHHGAGVL